MSISTLLQAAALLTIGFSFLTGLDIPHRNIELFSHFRLQYFVVSVLLLIGFAFLRQHGWTGALAVTALFNASFVLPWYFAEAPAATSTVLKLVHANVYSRNTDFDRLLEFVGAEKPDIIFLQEVTAEWVEGTRQLLAAYPYTYAEPRAGNFGIVVFSRIPFESVRHVDSPPFGHPTLIATIRVNGESLNLISSHPTIPIGQKLYKARNEQLESIAELVQQTPGRLVLLGDFNASTWDPRLRQLAVSTGLRNARRGFGTLPSWPTYLPIAMIPIDHAYVSQGISVTDVRTGIRIGSDHLPLIVTINL